MPMSHDARWSDDARHHSGDSRDLSRGGRSGPDRRSHDRVDPRDVFVEHVALPRGREREHVVRRGREYTLRVALTLHDLSDALPAKVDMTVPPGFRRMAAIPGLLRLHRGSVPKRDSETIKGVRVTTPLRTFIDVIVDDALAPEVLVQAVDQAIRRGLGRRQFDAADVSTRARQRANRILKRVPDDRPHARTPQPVSHRTGAIQPAIAIGLTERTSSARRGSTASSGTVTTPIDSPSALKSSSTHPRGPNEGCATKSTNVATSPTRSACSGKDARRATRS